MDPPQTESIVRARCALATLTQTVRASGIAGEITAAIRRRDALLIARVNGNGLDAFELARLEAERNAAGAPPRDTADNDPAPHVVRYLEAVAWARGELAARRDPRSVLAESLCKLGATAQIDVVLHALAHDEARDGIVHAARVHHAITQRATPTGDIPARAIAEIASAILLMDPLAAADDPMLIPAIPPNARIDAIGATRAPREPDDDWLGQFTASLAAAARRTTALAASLAAMNASGHARIALLGKAAESGHRAHRGLQRWPVVTIERVMAVTGLQVQAATSSMHRLRGLGIARETARQHRRRLYIHQGQIDALTADVESWAMGAGAGS